MCFATLLVGEHVRTTYWITTKSNKKLEHSEVVQSYIIREIRGWEVVEI